jgi:hypothetical protein
MNLTMRCLLLVLVKSKLINTTQIARLIVYSF